MWTSDGCLKNVQCTYCRCFFAVHVCFVFPLFPFPHIFHYGSFLPIRSPVYIHAFWYLFLSSSLRYGATFATLFSTVIWSLFLFFILSWNVEILSWKYFILLKYFRKEILQFLQYLYLQTNFSTVIWSLFFSTLTFVKSMGPHRLKGLIWETIKKIHVLSSFAGVS